MSLRRTSLVKSVLLASIAHFALVASSLGQAPAKTAYTEEQPNPGLLAKEKLIQQQIGRILRGTVPFDDTAKLQLNAYYQQVAFPKFTIKENWGILPTLREDLMKELRSAKVPQATQHAIGLIFNKMRTFTQTKENYHPAVRYNAMMVLADMNAIERGSRGADGRAAAYPDPLPAAFDVLLAEYKSPDQIDAVRVAALVGIDRHLKLDLVRPADRRIAGAKKQLVFDEMLALLNAGPPAGRSAEGHTWMKRRAIDILAVLGTIGVKAETNAALEKIVADANAPISLRCTASEALAHWTPTANKVDAGDVSQNLGLIAVKACKDELDRIAALERREKEMKDLRELIKKPNPVASGQFGASSGAGGGGGMMSGMMESYGGAAGEEGEEMMGGDMDAMYGDAGGGMMSGLYGGMTGGTGAEIPTDPRIVWSQRRLKYQLTCVKRGLEGMTIAGKATPQEKAIEKVKLAVEAALALTDPPKDKPTLEGLTESIQAGLSALAFLAPAAAGPAAELPPALDPAALAAPPAADPAALAPAAADPAALAPPPADPAAGAVDPLADPAALLPPAE